MHNGEELEQVKRNIMRLQRVIEEGTFEGTSKAAVVGIRFALREVLRDTSITWEELRQEFDDEK